MPRKLEDEYSIEEALGSGSYAEVYRCTHKKTGQNYAVKIINKAKAGPKGIKTTQNEVEILKALNHPNVINVKDYFESNSSMYIVLEIVSGGELFDKIVELKHYSEHLAAKLIRHIVITLKYLHDNKVCHRDLKPENLLLKTRLKKTVPVDEQGNVQAASQEEQKEVEDILTSIKLVDFGFAIAFEHGKRTLTECCGTPNFIAPEILEYGIFKTTREGYNEKCDMWSTGVLTYILLCGYPPFHANNRSQMFKKIVEGRYTYHKNTVWEKISPEAKEFISRLLQTSVEKRMSAQEALDHPWMQASLQRDDHLEEAMRDLKLYTARQKFRGAILGVEAAHRVMYFLQCKELEIKPNSALSKQLEDNGEEITEMDLSNNYLGAKGLQAALQTIQNSETIHTLKLKDNQIDNAAVTIIVDCLKTHSSITAIDLSSNPISQLAGRQLLHLLQQNHRIVDMSLEGTYIKPTFMKKINAQLARNKHICGKYAPKKETQKVPE
eukprot:TRINITY_DN13714_c0_g1_i1.p1 TRINITY_DN13714_c0_g1~~TRINITY_DN13714_c0_g1_i1.p1  ORF type:complete len:495 (-),score=59.01 TRINITY_DN13714_c0_g1_i1:125-1609(-)